LLEPLQQELQTQQEGLAREWAGRGLWLLLLQWVPRAHQGREAPEDWAEALARGLPLVLVLPLVQGRLLQLAEGLGGPWPWAAALVQVLVPQ